MRYKSLMIVTLLIIHYHHAFTQVGIGITTPIGKLHIKGSSNISQLIIDAHSTQSNTAPLIKLRNSSGADLMWIHTNDTSNIFIGLNAGRTNNLIFGTGIFNTFLGNNAGRFSTSGSFNAAFGSKTLYYNTEGDYNTAIGDEALYSNTTGDYNTAIGMNALYSNVANNGLTAIGYNAMLNANNTTDGFLSDYSVAVGYDALRGSSDPSANTGVQNTALGNSTLASNTSGGANTASGSQSMLSNTTGGNNTASGYQSLPDNLTGSSNTAIGLQALYSNVTGSNNTGIGQQSLKSNAGGNNNTAVGYNADVINEDVSNATAIGSHAYAGASNSVILGSIDGINGATASANVGIGTSTPHNKAILEIQSTSQGVLFPTMTTAQRDAIVNPPHGLHIFNSEEACLNYYDTIFQLWNCYCDQCKVRVVRIQEDTCSIDFYNNFAILAPAGNYIIIVEEGVTVSACDSNGSAMHFLNMPSDYEIQIINYGTIEGGGGNGGAGAIEPGCIAFSGFALGGSPGGHAILTKSGVQIQIENHGIIAGGGGGGGGSDDNPSGIGGGGGGGAGIAGGMGGPGGGQYQSQPPFGICVPVQNLASPGAMGTATIGGMGGAGLSGGGTGGNGGNRGQAGQNGQGSLPGMGGPAGKAISGGNGNVLVNLGAGQSFGVVD